MPARPAVRQTFTKDILKANQGLGANLTSLSASIDKGIDAMVENLKSDEVRKLSQRAPQ